MDNLTLGVPRWRLADFPLGGPLTISPSMWFSPSKAGHLEKNGIKLVTIILPLESLAGDWLTSLWEDR
jgi:hypothetical protein